MTQQRVLRAHVASLRAVLPFAASAAPLALDVQGMIKRTNDVGHSVYHIELSGSAAEAKFVWQINGMVAK